ncbi:hypothetical protein LG290_13055 [Halomonas sediminis]
MRHFPPCANWPLRPPSAQRRRVHPMPDVPDPLRLTG